MEISIREATVEDAKTISSIGVASWQAAYSGIVPSEYLDSLSIEKRERYVAKSLAVHTNRFMIAEADGQAVGMICFYSSNSETAMREIWELEALYLLPQYWNKGIGRKLIQYAFQYIRDHGGCNCNLWVLADNNRARQFYESAGLICIGIEKSIIIGGKELIEVCYSIPL